MFWIRIKLILFAVKTFFLLSIEVYQYQNYQYQIDQYQIKYLGGSF